MADLTPAQQALLDEAKDNDKTEESKDDETKAETAEEKSPDPPYQGKFKQFKTVTELETSFANSFTEAQRLNEKIKALEAEKADLTKDEAPKSQDEDKVKALEDKITQLESRLTGQEEKQKSEDERQFNSWMDNHPDLKDNDPLIQDLLEELGFVAQKAAKRKEFLSMHDGLDRAWQRIKPADTDDASELEGAKKQAQKEMAASAAPSSGAKADGKKATLTDDQKKTAKAYGFSTDEYIQFLNKE